MLSFLAACGKEVKASVALPLTGPYHSEGATSSDRLAASPNDTTSLRDGLGATLWLIEPTSGASLGVQPVRCAVASSTWKSWPGPREL